MAITAGQDILAADFIDEGEKNATPSNDEGRVAKLEADGKIHAFFTKNGEILTAGETINGATLPVPVYQNDSDNELYACDANDNTKYKFIGFAISNSTNGSAIAFQGSGVVGGFSSLQEGEKYYVQDTAGTIGTSPGTQEILVGVAISQTHLLIQKGKFRASGVTDGSDSTVTLGFRPSKVIVFATHSDGSISPNANSMGGWDDFGGNNCVYNGSDNSTNGIDGSAANAWFIRINSSSATSAGVIDTITDTGFNINRTAGSTAINLYWTAEGEL